MTTRGNRQSRSKQHRDRVAPFLETWEERGFNPHQQFRNWSVQQVLWDYGLSVAEVEDATSPDGPGDKGIDAWYYDEVDTPPRLMLIQAKDKQIKREDFSKLLDGFQDVMLPDRPGGANQTLLAKAAPLRDAMPPHLKLDAYLTSSVVGELSASASLASSTWPVPWVST